MLLLLFVVVAAAAAAAATVTPQVSTYYYGNHPPPTHTYCIQVGLASVGNDTVKHAAHYIYELHNQGDLLICSGRPPTAGGRGRTSVRSGECLLLVREVVFTVRRPPGR